MPQPMMPKPWSLMLLLAHEKVSGRVAGGGALSGVRRLAAAVDSGSTLPHSI
jgi:hypothetical protein